MNTGSLKHATDWFKIHSIRKIDDPSAKIDRRELVVSLDQYPSDIGLGPNPRRPDPKSRVARAILETLEENGENFHLMNRGITVLAKGLDYDNKTERVRLKLHETEDEEAHYGILDGGNTNAQINEWRSSPAGKDALSKQKATYVNVQVLVPREQLASPIEELLNDIKEARNSSVQVKQKSLADARHQYDLLKQVLQGEPYFDQIGWREGDPGNIDILQIITLLMVFYPPFSEDAPDREPNGAYGRKEKCLDAFLNYSDRKGEELNKWIRQVPKLLGLFDEIQYSFPSKIGGRFGGIAEVKVFDEKKYEKGSKKYRKTPSKSAFRSRDMKYEYPTGWLYPMYAGFRVLLGLDPQGDLDWKRDPFVFWKDHGQALCDRYEPHLKSVGYETKRVATSAVTYSAIRGGVTEFYKDDLLKEAGITA